MRHRCKRNRLGLKTNHREALLRGVINGLVLNNRVRTTITRAKAAKSLAERLVTTAKPGTLQARRRLIQRLHSEKSASRLIDEIAPLYKEQGGGYTRIIRLGYRAGDGAEMALLEFTRKPQSLSDEEEKKKKRKKERAEKKSKRKEEEVEHPEEMERMPEPEEKKKPPKKKEEKKKAKKKPKEEEPPKEEERGPGFLGGLRRFLKGGE